jgi:hypothetical protein
MTDGRAFVLVLGAVGLLLFLVALPFALADRRARRTGRRGRP